MFGFFGFFFLNSFQDTEIKQTKTKLQSQYNIRNVLYLQEFTSTDINAFYYKLQLAHFPNILYTGSIFQWSI